MALTPPAGSGGVGSGAAAPGPVAESVAAPGAGPVAESVAAPGAGPVAESVAGPGAESVAATRVPWVVGVSGASGTVYAAAVLRALLAAKVPVDLVVSRAARLTLLDETGISLRDGHWRVDVSAWLGHQESTAHPATSQAPAGVNQAPADAGRDPNGDVLGDLRYWAAGDLAGGPSSGSYPTRGMIVVPASTAACAGIALGLSKDLLQRAAEVNLKERRPVIVVPRETPVTRGHLEHLIALLDAGATVLPASPGFYSAGANASAAELIDFVAGKVLDAAGVPHCLFTRWTGARRTGAA